MLITSWGNISIHQCTGHDDHNHLRPDNNYRWTLKIPTWTFQNHHHLFELEPLRKVDPWCSSCPPHDRFSKGTFWKDNRWSWVKTERLYFAFSERMRNLVSVWPDSISSSAVTFASSHTLPSNLTALHLCTKIIVCLVHFFLPILMKFTSCETLHQIGWRLRNCFVFLPLCRR